MGYNSEVGAEVDMSKSAWKRLQKVKIDDDTVFEAFEDVDYEERSEALSIYSSGKHYHIHDWIEAIAEVKDVDTINTASFQGTETDDSVLWIMYRGGCVYLHPHAAIGQFTMEVEKHVPEFMAFIVANRLKGDENTLGLGKIIEFLSLIKD